MEYTKDLIFSVGYQTVKNGNKQKKTRSILHKVKKHKILTMILVSAFIFITLDVILVFNFIYLLGRI